MQPLSVRRRDRAFAFAFASSCSCHSNSPSRHLHRSRVSSHSSHVLGGSSHSPPPLRVPAAVGRPVGTHTAVVFPYASPPPSGAHAFSLLWFLWHMPHARPLPRLPSAEHLLRSSRLSFRFFLRTLLILAQPRPLLPLFPLMTPPLPYVSPSPTTYVMGPPPAPHLSPCLHVPQRPCVFLPSSTISSLSCQFLAGHASS